MWEYKDGEGLWENWKNTQTGEESVQNHTLRVVKKWCKQEKHQFKKPTTGTGTIITCVHCGQEVSYIQGYHDKNLSFID